jgi:hypothetical protein
MTPQSFSYGAIGSNGMVYMPPYGLNESIDYMLKLNPYTYEIEKISITVDSSVEKWIWGITHQDKIYFLPYGESKILIVDVLTDDISYVELPVNDGHGKYVMGHIYDNKIFALPHGDIKEFDHVLIFDLTTETVIQQQLQLPINDTKKWHTSQLLGDVIYAMPRGDRTTKPYFPYRIEYNCKTLDYTLVNLSELWTDLDDTPYSGTKYTTLAQYNGKLYAPPYCRNPNFDLMGTFIDGEWTYTHTGQTATSRKYYSNLISKNGKIYFPPAGHDEGWSELMIIDGTTNSVTIKELGIAKESKKYFAGGENSQGKIYFIPRGGCVCEPETTWKTFGDLTEVLVIDTKDDSTYTVDVSEHYKDSTTIEKYNSCVMVDDKIFAFPYGESEGFQDILVFDTRTETVIKKIDLNGI